MSDQSRMAAEVAVVVGALLLNLAVAPLGTEAFVVVPVTASLAAVSYAVWCLVHRKGVCTRWGIAPGSLTFDPSDTQSRLGCTVLTSFFLISLLPMVLAKAFLLHLPFEVGDLGAYLVWCMVQDFIFFAVTQRHLEDLTHPLFAVPVTAVLFGLSHFPFVDFVLLTTLAGLVWGFAYFTLRALWVVVLAHWLMGSVILG
jgi:membrane protease YdiL (CAAX protease family)